ncbi:MAG: phage major capsid protein [Beijerinckiaceae bacterium]
MTKHFSPLTAAAMAIGVPYKGPMRTAEASELTLDKVLEAANGVSTRVAGVEDQIKVIAPKIDTIKEIENTVNGLKEQFTSAVAEGNKATEDNIRAEVAKLFEQVDQKFEEAARLAAAKQAANEREAAADGEHAPDMKLAAAEYLDFVRTAATPDSAFGSLNEVQVNETQQALFEQMQPRFMDSFTASEREAWSAFNSEVASSPVANSMFRPGQGRMTNAEVEMVNRQLRLAGYNEAGFFAPGVTAPEYQVPEAFAEMLRCFDNPTEVLSMVNRRTIRKRKYRQWVELPDYGYGSWEAEDQCQPAASDPLPLPEPKEGQVYPVSAAMCIHMDNLEDADQDWGAYITKGLGERIRRTIASAVMFGDGKGKPLGLVNNVSQFDLAGRGMAEGAFIDWQNIEASSTLLNNAVATSGSLAIYGNRAGQVHLALTTNAWGERSNVIRFEGNNIYVGLYPYKVLTWLPQNAEIHKAANPLQAQKVNFLFGDMKQAYDVVVRKDVGLTRYDPVNGGTCVTFMARARVDGYVRCANAMIAFKSP